jgi:hypothetical protein
LGLILYKGLRKMAKGLPRSLANAKPGNEISPRRIRYVANSLVVSVTGGAATAKGFGTTVLGGLPEGNILVLGGIAYLKLSSTDDDVIATFGADLSIGTTATADATLDGTDVNILAETSMGTASGKATALVRNTIAALAMIDNTAADLELNLNVITDDNSVTDSLVGTFLCDGYVDLVYIVLGDD